MTAARAGFVTDASQLGRVASTRGAGVIQVSFGQPYFDGDEQSGLGGKRMLDTFGLAANVLQCRSRQYGS
ncbi:hypothetical protein MMAG44476_24884 [Mycolicibacterium mageritense DSM 44476 = CIP 104973]|uniref:Uncharacterized protein n=1 Tax=Mycolicibacterium mageritense TaxID=53462 RepID=A0AAI8U0I6_MYCME|nr:hypothetical protein EB73_35925 [Mycobacterium sp. SWH-M3]BBX37392.1 hypothetical protein MMAGJ_66740 [Mycolicibacterium mageritense]BDY32198.1 hypothetical protein hbim_06160 [Mycolicibacterium mageritense]GJJ18146.1 hypothetical protein MTY414_18190 [Mycolicibacterium mageritense]CDO25941.1 hypothetical protein BN978_06489 [Mycolicibacterium mageritense DSM 44476 = CIP 104973]